MQIVATSLIAVAGTLLGSVATFLIQRSTIRHQSNLARLEAMRGDRLDAIAAYGGAMHSYRKARMDRWHVVNGNNLDDLEDSRQAVYDLRTVVFDRRVRVRLLVDSDDLIAFGTDTIEAIDTIDPDVAHEEYLAACEESWTSIESFIDQARKHLAEASGEGLAPTR